MHTHYQTAINRMWLHTQNRSDETYWHVTVSFITGNTSVRRTENHATFMCRLYRNSRSLDLLEP